MFVAKKAEVKKAIRESAAIEGSDAALRRADGAACRPYRAFILINPRLDTPP